MINNNNNNNDNINNNNLQLKHLSATASLGRSIYKSFNRF